MTTCLTEDGRQRKEREMSYGVGSYLVKAYKLYLEMLQKVAEENRGTYYTPETKHTQNGFDIVITNPPYINKGEER